MRKKDIGISQCQTTWGNNWKNINIPTRNNYNIHLMPSPKEIRQSRAETATWRYPPPFWMYCICCWFTTPQSLAINFSTWEADITQILWKGEPWRMFHLQQPRCIQSVPDCYSILRFHWRLEECILTDAWWVVFHAHCDLSLTWGQPLPHRSRRSILIWETPTSWLQGPEQYSYLHHIWLISWLDCSIFASLVEVLFIWHIMNRLNPLGLIVVR